MPFLVYFMEQLESEVYWSKNVSFLNSHLVVG